MKSNQRFKGIMQLTGILFMLAVALPMFAGGNKPHVKVENPTHDFGMVKEDGGPISCEFTLVNEGEGNLVVIDAKADCGCTRPSFPKAPIAPGKSGKVKVTYNPLGRPGSFDKVVTLRTNGSPSKVRLKIRGTVTPKGK
ncbi:MAG: DUF1573 domain-containing protein [Muribaculaceae bacterium]|nr:DUF1573 domain-containing protein [Muribaculaceae bacterium]MDE6753101.1 DUF1573 domain-containing protein [Muribaculaceae bacterium]